jgi:hypothetical protein
MAPVPISPQYFAKKKAKLANFLMISEIEN